MTVPRLLTAAASVVTAASVLLTGCGGVSRPSPENTPSVMERDPYPDGYLPVGDGLYDATGPRQGYLHTCAGFADSLGSAGVGGAAARGPWFTPDGSAWNPALKPHVRGAVEMPGRFTATVREGRRIIDTNGLPAAHPVGQFPVADDDPVRAIDPNPNTIAEHARVYDLPARPAIAERPGCVGHQVGVMLRGAALYSPLDALGRDAVAWEVQDRCDGHPEPDGTYHYHGPSPCLTGTDTADVIGFALDGFPITGNRAADGAELYSRDLDECHGSVATIRFDGQLVTTYRYAMTRDWPYTVACFRGGAVSEP